MVLDESQGAVGEAEFPGQAKAFKSGDFPGVVRLGDLVGSCPPRPAELSVNRPRRPGEGQTIACRPPAAGRIIWPAVDKRFAGIIWTQQKHRQVPGEGNYLVFPAFTRG
jgi:hypothetical protein